MSNILERANEIVNLRSEEKAREYGDFDTSMQKAAKIASIMSGKKITKIDAYYVMIGVKMSRESHKHKEDNLLDMVAYAAALNNMYEDDKHTHREVNMSGKGKVKLIVGQCPLKLKPGYEPIAFLRGRSSKFIMSIASMCKNVVLTNAVNRPFKKLTPELFEEGRRDLDLLIRDYEPEKIIALGELASDMLTTMAVEHVKMTHPSWVLRFNKGIEDYKQTLFNHITK